MNKTRLSIAAVLALLATGSALANPIAPISYAMPNGSGVAHGMFNYFDQEYTGSGSVGSEGAALSGGLGNLTDGFVTTQNWRAVENLAGTGPYVGWNAGVTPTVAIVFSFAAPVSIDTVSVHADGSGGAGGVSLPASALITWAGGSALRSIVDSNASTAPSWLDFTGLGIRGASNVTVQLNYGSTWMFVDEIKFDQTAFAAAAVTQAVPEPETYALMLAGFAVMTGIARRRKFGKPA